jgi:hypothetical protein
VRFHQAERTFIQAHVDALTFAGLAARQQSHDDTEGSIDAGRHIGYWHGRAYWRSIRIAVDVKHAADGINQESVTGPVTVGTYLAKSADAWYQQAGVNLAEGLVAQPPLLQHARPKVFDQHIAFRCQLAHQPLAVSLAHVESDETLVAQDTGRIERLAADMPWREPGHPRVARP